MTEKQKRFCEEYITDCNATQAATRAGYSSKTAYSIGQNLLKKVEIQNYIKELSENAKNEKIATAREVMEHLTAVMKGEVKEQTLIWIGDGKQDITEIAVSERDRLKAAELLGKRYGLFTDKVDVNGVATVIFEGEGKLDD
jgi:phage terminase small subunit